MALVKINLTVAAQAAEYPREDAVISAGDKPCTQRLTFGRVRTFRDSTLTSVLGNEVVDTDAAGIPFHTMAAIRIEPNRAFHSRLQTLSTVGARIAKALIHIYVAVPCAHTVFVFREITLSDQTCVESELMWTALATAFLNRAVRGVLATKWVQAQAVCEACNAQAPVCVQRYFSRRGSDLR